MVSTETFKPTSYSEQQYLAFKRNVEVPVTLENVKIIATPILEARLKKIQSTSLNGREINEILNEIFETSRKNKSPIPVKGTVNGKEFTQNLMKYLGEWRLYINLTMLKDSPKRIGEILEIFIEFDNSDRTISIHPDLEKAIQENSVASKSLKTLFLQENWS